jgi:hypothetical protein
LGREAKQPPHHFPGCSQNEDHHRSVRLTLVLQGSCCRPVAAGPELRQLLLQHLSLLGPRCRGVSRLAQGPCHVCSHTFRRASDHTLGCFTDTNIGLTMRTTIINFTQVKASTRSDQALRKSNTSEFAQGPLAAAAITRGNALETSRLAARSLSRMDASSASRSTSLACTRSRLCASPAARSFSASATAEDICLQHSAPKASEHC